MHAKNTAKILIFMLLAAVALAEPPRYRTSRRNGALRTNIRFLERQQEAEAEVPTEAPTPSASPAPYPAAGITPETPFELPTETEAVPAIEPEQAYGPPEAAEPPVEPDNLYGPPAAEAPASNVAPQNIIQPRSRGLILSAVPLPQQFAPRAGLVEIIRSEPILVYTLKK